MVVWRCGNSAIKNSLSTIGESFSLFLLDLHGALFNSVEAYNSLANY